MIPSHAYKLCTSKGYVHLGRYFSADKWMKTEEWNCSAQWKAFSVVRENGVTDMHLVDLPLAMRKCFWNEEHLSNLFQNAHASQHARFLLTVACNAATVPPLKWFRRSHCHILVTDYMVQNVSRCINHLNLADLVVKKGAKCNSSQGTHISFLLAFCILIFLLEMWGPPPKANCKEIQRFKAPRQIYLFGTICL